MTVLDVITIIGCLFVYDMLKYTFKEWMEETEKERRKKRDGNIHL